jgi:hypothetical protein
MPKPVSVVTDFSVRLIETEDALARIIVSTKEMLGEDDALDALMKEIATDPSSVLAYPKLKPYAKKIAEATLERNTARTALDIATEAKDMTPAQLKYDVALQFKKQEDAFETERAIWRESEKAFKLTIEALNTRMDALELSSKWSYGKCVLHNKFGYGIIASPVVDGNIYVLLDYARFNYERCTSDESGVTVVVNVKCTDITVEPRKSRKAHTNDIFRIKEIESKREIFIRGGFYSPNCRLSELHTCRTVMLQIKDVIECSFDPPYGYKGSFPNGIHDISILSNLDIESSCTAPGLTECTIVRVRTFCDQLNDYI